MEERKIIPDDIRKRLREPFAPSDIEWRIQQSGENSGKPWALVLAYVTNRAIMDRLDEVFGIDGWQNKFMPGPDGGVMCGISVKFGDDWITKYDGAENTEIEKIKGGISSSMKRAAVQWGIGRYLYDLDVTWADINPNGQNRAKTKSGTAFKWDSPSLPGWALPEGHKAETLEKQQKPKDAEPSKETTPSKPMSTAQYKKAYAMMKEKKMNDDECRDFAKVCGIHKDQDPTMAKASEFFDNFDSLYRDHIEDGIPY